MDTKIRILRPAQWISDFTACEIAGVTPAVLERMKAADVIRSDIRWREDFMKDGPVERQSLLDLYARVQRWASSAAVADDATLSWSELPDGRRFARRAVSHCRHRAAGGDWGESRA